MLGQLPPITDPRVLVGLATSDDAAVYRLNDEQALVQTLDFFTPIVDDPFDFGAIAAANALSDIYAMGGQPLLALNIVAFPSEELPLEVLHAILAGGADKAAEAGIPVVGGHSIDDPEPKYGMMITGMVHPDRIVTNAGARPSDVLVLTKPLGMGIVATAIKRERASEATIAEATHIMTTLNRHAAEAMVEVGANACTDVTGYGLLGHLQKMLAASGVGARLWLGSVPVLADAWRLAEEGLIPGGTRRNHDFVCEHVDWQEDVTEIERLVLCDAQTSGGLLIAVAADLAEELVEELQDRETLAAAVIGEIVAEHPGRIAVTKS